MASMVEDRIAVGTCEMGNVFIFHFAEKSETNNDDLVNHSWQVRAGNHTVATVFTAERAEQLARALVEDSTSDFATTVGDPADVDGIPETITEVVKETRKRVSKG